VARGLFALGRFAGLLLEIFLFGYSKEAGR
jgi:hypothetical protein